VTLPPEGLLPSPGERGRVSDDLTGTLEATIAAWDELLAAVVGVDLTAGTRKAGRDAARVLVVLGSWPEGRPLARIRSDALAGIVDAEPLDVTDGRVIATHGAASRESLIASLQRARDDIAEWSASSRAHNEALLPVAGPLGIVPLGTLVAATAYQCAVAARDLEPAGARASDQLLAHGLTALIDTVGAVAAQQDAALSLMAITPQVSIGTGARDGDWRTVGVDAPEGPALVCDAGLLLDIASGRASAPAAYTRGDLRAQDLTGLLQVAQVLARSPGLPGTDGLRSALQAYDSSAAVARAVSGAVGSAWRRLRGS
jgi:hypothetical protein